MTALDVRHRIASRGAAMRIPFLRAKARRLLATTIVMAVLLPSLFGAVPTPRNAPVLADVCSAAHLRPAEADGHGAPARRAPSHGSHCPLCVPVAQVLAVSSDPELFHLAPQLVTDTADRLRVTEVRLVIVQAAHPRGPPPLS